MTVKSKFKPGEVVYFKYPSRYTRSKDPNRIEVILKIVSIAETETWNKQNINYHYVIKIIKTISGKRGHWSSGEGSGMGWNIVGQPIYHEEFGVDSIEIETFSRRLTPAESVLYG